MLCLLAPHVLGDGLDECDLGPLLVFGELVAFLGGGEAALGGQAQAVERNVLGGFLDAGLDGVRILKVGLLGGDQAEHDLLVAGDFGERREIAGTVVVELEVVGVHVLLAEQLGRDRRVASGGKPGGVKVAAAHVGVDDQVVRLVGDHGVDDVEVLLLQA